MRLVTIPKEKYDEYRLDVIFEGYKWDPQFLDSSTIARQALLLTEDEATELQHLTARLSAETIAIEQTILSKLSLAKRLHINRKTHRLLKRMKNYQSSRHIRLMRFDFHPTIEGWAISEVNSDVPGGFAEASIMPRLAAKTLENYNTDQKAPIKTACSEESLIKADSTISGVWYTHSPKMYGIDFGDNLTKAIAAKVRHKGTIALVHCTSYSDDRQVMQYIGSRLQKLGFRTIYCAADHISFSQSKAICILDSQKCELDGLLRFTPLEWMTKLPKAWHGYFGTTTPSCNHPIAVFTQTKRLPLIFDLLKNEGVDLDTWQKLLPTTMEVSRAKREQDMIFKPVNGRVGESISIKNAISDAEYKKIIRNVRLHPRRYISQKMFKSLPIASQEGEEFHLCIGSYSIDGEPSGFYARISKTKRIDSLAADIPVLIEKI